MLQNALGVVLIQRKTSIMILAGRLEKELVLPVARMRGHALGTKTAFSDISWTNLPIRAKLVHQTANIVVLPLLVLTAMMDMVSEVMELVSKGLQILRQKPCPHPLLDLISMSTQCPSSFLWAYF